jgi:hypothetical protein
MCLCWSSTTKINYRKWLTLFPFHSLCFACVCGWSAAVVADLKKTSVYIGVTEECHLILAGCPSMIELWY